MLKPSHKFIIIFSILIIVILSLNLGDFFAYYNNNTGNKNFLNNNFLESEENYNKALKWKKNNLIFYNLAGTYYKKNEFEKSKDYYLKANYASGTQDFFDLNYNLGNTFYRIGENSSSIEDKINNYKQSLESYKKILNIKEDKKTKENYDFVMKKLQEIEEEENSQKQENSSSGSQDSKKNNQQQDKTNSGSQSEISSSSQEKANLGEKNEIHSGEADKNQEEEGKKSEENTLTNVEKMQLENHNIFLNNEQKNYIDDFGKQFNNLDENSLFDIFKQDPFFDNFRAFDDSINQEEKDW